MTSRTQRPGDRKLKTTNKTFRITEETFDSLASYWLDPGYPLEWDCLFVLPGWLKVWWSVFSNGSNPYIFAVRDKDNLIGLAPLLVEGDEARFIGDPDVCDYQDFIVAPGRGKEFFETLFDRLKQEGIRSLDLNPVRTDSKVLTELVGVAKTLECEVSYQSEDVTLELDLPATWDEFLGMLSGKQRHEVRRKLRRLHEAAEINYRVVEDYEAVMDEVETFLALFGLSRSDKVAFMTSQMATYFRSLAETMAKANLLRLFFLDLDGTPAAAVMCFDYNSTIYLYNNGYDGRFSSLSVGLLSKVLAIKESILRGRRKYDFLKGAEEYKHRLGGKPITLYRCQVKF
ncbi:MAG: GNAT family N-acetyltransferase [Deltaproteobacteria bacterium]|nr:MAG: GNAT family N-acetyltransferase [Deltaproteobacteria bacterium]